MTHPLFEQLAAIRVRREIASLRLRRERARLSVNIGMALGGIGLIALAALYAHSGVGPL